MLYTVFETGFSVFTREQIFADGYYYFESELMSGNVVQIAFYNTNIILTEAQVNAIEYVLAYDYGD